MEFNEKIKCISIGKFAKQVFTELDKIRPNGISFSMFLAIAAKHYVDTHEQHIDIAGEVPEYFSHIENWKSEIKNMSVEEFVKLQKRHVQLGNLINKEVLKKI